MAQSEPTRTHCGPFITRFERILPDGRRLVHTSRRHRKGIGPLAFAGPGPEPAARSAADAAQRGEGSPWLRLWAPSRLGWWIAVLFFVGSALFLAAAYLANWPPASPTWLGRSGTVGWGFFVGSLFFTAAAALQLLEAINGDVAEVHQGDHAQPPRWRWFAWKPRNLGYLASLVQLVGTLLFNVNTADSLVVGSSVAEADVLVWTPNVLGCVCFLVASVLAYVEYSHGRLAIAPRSLSWWIVTINLVGSVLFALAAGWSFEGSEPVSDHQLWVANFYTMLGAVCFLAGSYLLLPELFEGPGEPTPTETDCA